MCILAGADVLNVHEWSQTNSAVEAENCMFVDNKAKYGGSTLIWVSNHDKMYFLDKCCFILSFISYVHVTCT